PLRSTLFPYTTLFRSEGRASSADDERELVRVERLAVETVRLAHTLAGACRDARMPAVIGAVLAESAARIAVEVISEEVLWTPVRSEEHTSELQSRFDL